MDLKGAINVIKNIKDKNRMTFDYCLKNKFNYFYYCNLLKFLEDFG